MHKNIIAVLLVISVVSVFLIGSSITGFIVMDETVKSVCTSDSACTSPEVCCFFYEQDSGVCNTEDMCGKVLEITQVQKEKEAELRSILGTKYDEIKVNNNVNDMGQGYNQMFMYGSMILLLTFLVLVLYIRHHYLAVGNKKVKSTKG